MKYDSLKKLLEEHERGRERKHKNEFLAFVLRKKHSHIFTEITNLRISEFIGDVLSADRMWRKVLEENESLRGKDYDDKHALEAEAKHGLGYDMFYEKDKKKLKTL